MHPKMIKKKIFYKKMRRRPNPLWQKCAAGKYYETKWVASWIFGFSPDKYSVLLIFHVIFPPQITAQNPLLFINEWINSFINWSLIDAQIHMDLSK